MTTLSNATGERIAGPESSGADLLNVRHVARLLTCSPRSIYRLADAGKMPRPVKLGGLVRWRADELRAWIANGCPTCRMVKRPRATDGGAA